MSFAETLGISKREFYNIIGVSRGTLESGTGITEDTMTKFFAKFPQVSPVWLLTGQGEMLLSSSNGNTNYLSGGNNMLGSGNKVNGSMGHITMPESGTQKIIKPSGEVEIQRTDSTKSEGTKEAELHKEIELMKQRVALMEDNMKMKDELIASLKDTIELLRNRQ